MAVHPPPNKEKHMKKIYLAYGSNMNLRQMAHRCPDAEVLGTSVLKNHHLTFRGGKNLGVATVEKRMGAEVPVLLWSISENDEKALDIYEGYPYLYRKENRMVEFDGKKVKAMVYIMNEGRPASLPSTYYYATIAQGYKDNGLDTKLFEDAVSTFMEEIRCHRR